MRSFYHAYNLLCSRVPKKNEHHFFGRRSTRYFRNHLLINSVLLATFPFRENRAHENDCIPDSVRTQRSLRTSLRYTVTWREIPPVVPQGGTTSPGNYYYYKYSSRTAARGNRTTTNAPTFTPPRHSTIIVCVKQSALRSTQKACLRVGTPRSVYHQTK